MCKEKICLACRQSFAVEDAEQYYENVMGEERGERSYRQDYGDSVCGDCAVRITRYRMNCNNPKKADIHQKRMAYINDIKRKIEADEQKGIYQRYYIDLGKVLENVRERHDLDKISCMRWFRFLYFMKKEGDAVIIIADNNQREDIADIIDNKYREWIRESMVELYDNKALKPVILTLREYITIFCDDIIKSICDSRKREMNSVSAGSGE